MAYNKQITFKKGVDGGVEGSVVVLISLVITGLLKRYVMDMDATTENAVTALVGTVVSGVFLGLTRAVRNWLKHKNCDIN